MAWQQSIKMWQPDEIERASTGMYGLAAKDAGSQMKANWEKMAQSSSGPNPYEQQEASRYRDEQSMLQREQQRREFDSQTAREAQQQKSNVLAGLLGGPRRLGGRR
jgi:hypothetical protein